MKTFIRLLLSLAITLTSEAECCKILVFFCNSARSHHIVFQPIIRALALRGHQVDYYTHFPIADPPKNLNQIVFNKSEESMQQMEEINMVEWGRSSIIYNSKFMREYVFEEESNCDFTPPVQELFASNKTYDMVVGEFYFFQEHFAYLIHKFNAVGVAFSSLPDSNWVNEMSGLPDNPAYLVHFLADYSNILSFSERVINFLNTWAVKLIDFGYVMTLYQSSADRYFRYEGWESRPPLTQMASDVALILVNSHHSLGYPFPKAPHVKEIMGTNVDENPEPLPKDLQEYMDSAEHGVIYFSLGSMLSVKELKMTGGYDALVKVFSNLRQKVLWKWTSWSGGEVPILPNIKMAKWFPQNGILAHNKTRLFITHGGLGGMTESISRGVPMIGLPVFGDQFKNVRLMSSAGFGIGMDFLNISEASVSWAVNEVLNNPRYKEEAARRSLLFKDRPLKPLDEAIYWIEYVLKYGKVLQPASARLPFYQLYLLDVMVTLVASVVGVVFIIKRTVQFCISSLNNRTKQVNKSNGVHKVISMKPIHCKKTE